MQGVSLRPRPTLKIEESRRPDDGAVADPHRGKRDRRSRAKPFQRRIDVANRFVLALRYRTPAIKTRRAVRRSIDSRSRHQGVYVTMIEGFKPHVSARKYEGFCFHDFSMQRVACSRNAGPWLPPWFTTARPLDKTEYVALKVAVDVPPDPLSSGDSLKDPCHPPESLRPLGRR